MHSDVGRWDKFAGKGADSKRLKLATEVKRLLLSRIPESSRVGIFHGDFQWSILFYSKKAKLLAVIDWELV